VGLIILTLRPFGLLWVFPALAFYFTVFTAAGYTLRTSLAKIDPSPILPQRRYELF